MNEPIAIIGSACRFAGDATSPSKLWELLHNPRDVLREIPKERFSSVGFYHPNNAHHGHTNVRHAYTINEDVAKFDTEFFGIKPVEARAIDPQQRLLMETVYEGLENAGLPLDELRGSNTSVYVGVMCNDYEDLLLRDLQSTPTYLATGIGRSILSNRLSYFFDWHGPSITMDTACSSSLVAVHMAVQTLRSGESRVAVACGSNLLLGPENFIVESKLKMLSPDGRSKMWDRDANGYARGDGVGAVILKTLSQAIADGDHIDCVIRETSLNQDGATKGITMPSSTAQRDLILATYRKAGLNLGAEGDRPQYFEAHGTGTPAGDPIEAEAIAKAFYGETMAPRPGEQPLYVGSIKTVLGHTEGTAGIAAILKASLALQNATIPPNLLFNELSEGVKPFYENLEIPTAARPWPRTEAGHRRASVNSFGFGGANAHAILESYPSPVKGPDAGQPATVFAPFVFSALSEASLRATLTEYSSYLQSNPDVDPLDLAYTLCRRRTVLPHRLALPAGSIQGLQSALTEVLTSEGTPVGVRALPASVRAAPKLLGIFTGQGAQYARMGAELIERSPTALRTMQRLESDLARLPDRPTWSLQAELLAAAQTSRIGEAAISQPLCTAVQIMLLDLLREAKVHLDAVVGHSSGEIAAAYASGFLSARDAIVVAYYRGVHAQLAAGPTGARGAMIAVGTSVEDAQELCRDEAFAGRISLAACNSASSVTISGDEDAVDELQVVLQDEQKFCRKLRVDTAYHSAHMLPAFAPYVESVRAAGVKAMDPGPGHCTWFSSVYDGPVSPAANLALGDSYWADNMTKPVLFFQAVSRALASSPQGFDVAIEVGPHPALKGPAAQTMQEVLQKEVPYTGVLARNTDAVASLREALGFLWCRLDQNAVDLHAASQALAGGSSRPCRLLKGLPTYQWNHETRHWHESRRSLKLRTQARAPHPLLGDVSPDSAPHTLEWRNLLRPKELPWLDGHRVQSQVVFPAAGYASSAFEAAKSLAGAKPIRLLELAGLAIHQAVVFSDEEAGVETVVRLTDIEHVSPDRLTAAFAFSADLGSGELTLAATATVDLRLGEPSTDVLPERAAHPPHTIAVETDRFYRSLADLGYNFSGRFRSLDGLRRKHGLSACRIRLPAHESGEEPLLAHPADLDASFQSIILAYAYPYDDQLRMMHLPTSIARIRLNPALCGTRDSEQIVPVDATLSPSADGTGFTGDCVIYAAHTSHAAIQVEGVALRPLGSMTAAHDRKVFSKMHWIRGTPDMGLVTSDTTVTEGDREVLRVLERMSTYYLRQFDQQVPADAAARHERPNSCYLNYAKHMTALVSRGENPWVQKQWQEDTLADVYAATDPYQDAIPDIRIMHLVGQQMPRVFRGETTMLEEFRESGLLDNYYTQGFGFRQVCKWLSRVLVQICDRYPHVDILEIGAGTGGATKSILPALAGNFRSFTFSDVSAGFFENASAVFADYQDKMRYQVLDLEKDPLEQGYSEASYDVIVGSLVVHATAELEKTMRNLRRLLKPGGFLVIGEGSHSCSTGGFIFGPLAGWWLGVDEGRTLTPFVTGEEWDRILKATGFSGLDTATPKDQEDVYGVTVWVAQAVDEEVRFIRQPLEAPPGSRRIERLAIVGGRTANTAGLVADLVSLLKPHAAHLRVFETPGHVDYEFADAGSSVISLADLDAPVFEELQPETWQAVKRMFAVGNNLMWLTSGREADQPYANMTVGFGRTAHLETPGIRIQFVDVPEAGAVDSRAIAEAFLRFHVEVPEERTDILWTVESEILIDQAGNQLVPRLRPIQELNDRYNSAYRPIEHKVDTRTSAVQLQREPAGYVLKQLSPYAATGGTEAAVELRITHSLLCAVPTPVGPQFLVLGREEGTGARYMALVSSVTTVTNTAKGAAVPCEVANVGDEFVLWRAAAFIVAAALCEPLFAGEKLVVHNAPEPLLEAINTQAASKGLAVVNLSDTAAPGSAVHVPPYLGSAEAGRLLPDGVRSFAGFSNHTRQPSDNESTLLHALPHHVRKETLDTLYSSHASPAVKASAQVLGALTQAAVQYVRSEPADKLVGIPPPLLTPEAVVEQKVPPEPSTVVDWASVPVQRARVCRLDSRPMFKADKTYWMVGLSGALGISLCDWMIESGARHLVLTSRNPKIAPEWVAAHGRKGVNVTIMPCDVTDEPRLRSVHEDICRTMPPIIGVLNGAMVLRDVSIQNMSYEQLMGVTRPKVLGSVYLDRIFDHQALDFFLCFSSINCVVGNLGQANYAAANMFMCAMAANRRKRGLAGSALNVGAIIGAGYMERESSKALDLTVSKMALMHLSENDFHQLFAEGVEAGRPGAVNGPEVSTGLLDINADADERPRWCKDPKFLHFIRHETGTSAADGRQVDSASISDLLGGAKTKGELRKVIQGTFASQLRNVLQMTTSDEDLMGLRSVEIGLDSLISVDIRAWFLKNFHVSIPVLKIMGNDTMAALVEYAAESIPPELVPQLGLGTDADVSPSSDAPSLVDDASVGAGTPVERAGSSAASSDDSASTTSEDLETKGMVDYETESAPPADFAEIAERTATGMVAKPTPEVVLLTGVSGLLGHHLLDHLLEKPGIKRVICVAVRNLTERLNSGQLPRNERVSYFAGDLCSPRLGLSENDAAAIFTEVDAVIHNGADTSHLKYYPAIKSANVSSTRWLTRMCLPRRVPLHYVSSVGVCLFSPGLASFPETSATAHAPPPDGSHGYIASKWTNEKFLERVNALYGLPVYIHRPSTIIREGVDTHGVAAQLDWVNGLVAYSHRIRAVPKCQHVQGALDFVSVHNTVQDIARHVMEGGQQGTPSATRSVTYVHQVGDLVLPINDMKTLSGTGKPPYEELPMADWAAKAIASGMHPAVAALIETIDMPGTMYPRMLKA